MLLSLGLFFAYETHQNKAVTELCKKSVLFLEQAHTSRHPFQTCIASASVVLSAKGSGMAYVNKEEDASSQDSHSRYCSALKLLLMYLLYLFGFFYCTY